MPLISSINQKLSQNESSICVLSFNPFALRKDKIVYIEDIYFFEVNTKYISSNVMKISVNSRVRNTSEFMIFSTRDEIFLVFTKKKRVNFLFLFLFCFL